MVGFLLFKIRYYLYVSISRLFKPKRNEFIMFFLGRYPENFKHGFKAILDANSIFRYSIGSACIVLRFDTKKNIFEIQEILNKVYYGYMDSFFIFDAKSVHAKVLDQVHYKHLYDPNTQVKTPDQSLNRIHEFIEVLQQMRYNFIKLMNQTHQPDEVLDNERFDGKVTMEDIDPILEKIKEYGIESLTENERLILKKYTKND
jgi:hypothetical protein